MSLPSLAALRVDRAVPEVGVSGGIEKRQWRRGKRPARPPRVSRISEPFSQEAAAEWFELAQPLPSQAPAAAATPPDASATAASGAFGEVRFVTLEDTSLNRREPETVYLAVKKLGVQTQYKMRNAYNEYHMHHALYDCIPGGARRLFTRPYRMVFPCVERTFVGIPALPLLETIPSMAPTSHTLVECGDLSEVYTVQQWGCDGGLPARQLEPRGEYEHVMEIGAELGYALWHMHNCGFRHNDLHAGNVLVCEGRHCKLIDFGFATHEEGLAPSQELFDDEIFSLTTRLGNANGNPLVRAAWQAYRSAGLRRPAEPL